uniref:Interleukin 17 receptor B n=2 Tax=Macaca TaxID=9539 RepID=I7GCB5_MACFA|nr:unnamed protein product [Macaca fascicularis]
MVLSQLIGSLWDPNITACKKNEETVEVNFTTSPLGNRYMALIQHSTIIGFSQVSETEASREAGCLSSCHLCWW